MKKAIPLTIAALFTVLSGLAAAQTDPLSSHVEKKTKADDCVRDMVDSDLKEALRGVREIVVVDDVALVVKGGRLEYIKDKCVKETGEPLVMTKGISRFELNVRSLLK